LAIEGIQHTAYLLLDVYEASGARDGYVSLEVSPDYTNDIRNTIIDAKRLWRLINRPNLIIRIPGRIEGDSAISSLIEEGININFGPLPDLQAYKAAADAYLLGIESRLKSGREIACVLSIASFAFSGKTTFIERKTRDRTDAWNADMMDSVSALRESSIECRSAVYRYLHRLTGSARWRKLAKAGARPQRPIWISLPIQEAETYAN
jgi:hypothetical protein